MTVHIAALFSIIYTVFSICTLLIWGKLDYISEMIKEIKEFMKKQEEINKEIATELKKLKSN